MENKRVHFHRPLFLTSALFAATTGLPVEAVEIETSDPDWSVRFDNTVKLNYAQRVEAANSKITSSKNLNYNDGDNNFDVGTPVSQRVDLMSELDVVYKGVNGVRVSAGSWYDQAYQNVGSSNPSTNNVKNGYLDSDGISSYADRYYAGLSGEILDAFVFTGTEFSNGMLLNTKIGQTTNNWGETLFSAAHGVGFAQSGIDAAKSYAVPGTEAKELYLPRNQIYASLIINEEVSVAAQYFLGWRPTRLPESGTYLSWNDTVQFGGSDLALIAAANPYYSSLLTRPEYLWFENGHTYKPANSGDYGVSTTWSPHWLNGTMGFYYRNLSDVLPYVGITQTISTATAALSAGGSGQLGYYNQYYADNIHLFGFSLSKDFSGISVGWDLNYRENMPLQSYVATVNSTYANAGVFGYVSSLPTDGGEIPGARGRTLHSVLNGLMTLQPTPVWDTAALALELSYNHLIQVTDNENLFKGSSDYHGIDKVTPNFWGFQGTFKPTWYQVFPGVDLSLPVAYGIGLSGHSAVQSGGDVDTGNYSVGIAADVKNQYSVELKYVDYFGKFDTCETGTDGAVPGTAGTYSCTVGQITSYAGPNAMLKDRGFVAATFKTTF